MNKKEKRKKALAELKERAVNFGYAKLLIAQNDKFVKSEQDDIRKLAKKAGLKESGKKVKLFPVLADENVIGKSKHGSKKYAYLRVNFPEPLVIDDERFMRWLSENYPERFRDIVKVEVSMKIDRKMLEALEEQGEINVDECYGGKNPIMQVVDGTPALYIDVE